MFCHRPAATPSHIVVIVDIFGRIDGKPLAMPVSNSAWMLSHLGEAISVPTGIPPRQGVVALVLSGAEVVLFVTVSTCPRHRRPRINLYEGVEIWPVGPRRPERSARVPADKDVGACTLEDIAQTPELAATPAVARPYQGVLVLSLVSGRADARVVMSLEPYEWCIWSCKRIHCRLECLGIYCCVARFFLCGEGGCGSERACDLAEYLGRDFMWQ